MEALSYRYGWTPEQIRNMSIEDIKQYLEIISEIHKIERGQAFKNNR